MLYFKKCKNCGQLYFVPHPIYNSKQEVPNYDLNEVMTSLQEHGSYRTNKDLEFYYDKQVNILQGKRYYSGNPHNRLIDDLGFLKVKKK